MFGHMMHLHRRVRSYPEALGVYNGAHVPRATPTVRPLRGKRFSNKSIRMLAAESLALRLHETDVVVYHHNGDIDINVSYASKSTVEFADRLSPLSFSLLVKIETVLLNYRDTYYAVNDTLHVRDGTIIGARQIMVGTINRKHMREAFLPYKEGLETHLSMVDMLDANSMREYVIAYGKQAYSSDTDPYAIFWHNRLNAARSNVTKWKSVDHWREKMRRALRAEVNQYLLHDSLLDWTPLQPGVHPSRHQRIKPGELVRLSI